MINHVYHAHAPPFCATATQTIYHDAIFHVSVPTQEYVLEPKDVYALFQHSFGWVKGGAGNRNIRFEAAVQMLPVTEEW